MLERRKHYREIRDRYVVKQLLNNKKPNLILFKKLYLEKYPERTYNIKRAKRWLKENMYREIHIRVGSIKYGKNV